jgi:enoyl-CoA hydratase
VAHDYEDILVSKTNGVATIMVNRPEKLNAVRLQTMIEIGDALRNIETDEQIRVLVLTGAGDKAFVAGADIAIMAREPDNIRTLHEFPKAQEITCQLANFRMPVICRINGYALGGGTELALACDIRIASENAVLGLPEIKLGIIPGYGGTQRLPRLIGMGIAKRMIFTGEHIRAEKALEIGLVDEVVPLEELDQAVMRLAEIIGCHSPVALLLAKSAMNKGIEGNLVTGLDLETRCFSLCFGTQDRVEGMNAFLEKRAPEFKGK